MEDHLEHLARLLKAKNFKLVTAESCTGGLLAATITHKPGASEFFERGFVTYSNEAKTECLGVLALAIDRHGAVSEQTAEAMAKGALENSNAQLAVSITGVAGPDGGSEEKPVGTVFFGYALQGGSSGSVKHHFSGDRQAIQKQAASTAIKHLISVLEDKDE